MLGGVQLLLPKAVQKSVMLHGIKGRPKLALDRSAMTGRAAQSR
jgi:hypothetical protein